MVRIEVAIIFLVRKVVEIVAHLIKAKVDMTRSLKV